MTTDARGAKVQAKIRDAQLELIPYMMVIGPKEAESGSVALRDRIEGDLGAMKIEDAIAKLQKEVADRAIRQVASTETASAEIPENATGAKNEY